VIFDEKGSFMARCTILFLVVDGKVKVHFLTFDFRLGFMVVEVKIRLLCDF